MNQLDSFLLGHNLRLVKKLSKGWTSFIYLVENFRGDKFVLKVLREKSNRKSMVRREAENLSLANSVGVGPKLVLADSEAEIVMMEFIEGVTFPEWIDSGPAKGQLENFIDGLYAQAKKLDKIGLDHGQLAGKGKNILVRKGLPVIIDFEKASTNRKCHNVKVLDSFLFRSRDSGVVKRIAQILGEKGA